MTIDFLGWLAALVSLMTGIAMLSDMYLSARKRRFLRLALHTAVNQLARWQWPDRQTLSSLRHALRFAIRGGTLILIVAASAVCVGLPVLSGELSASRYEVLLRIALAVYLAIQSPCPWYRYVVYGRKPQEGTHGH